MTTDNGSRPAATTPAAVGLPAIPVFAGALVFDRAGRLLILRLTDKSGWTIPGGVMEADEETLWDACRREVTEECGLHIDAGHRARLACMDFRRPRPGKQGGIRYLFDCDAFSDANLARIVVQPGEIAECRLVELRTALTMLRDPVRRRAGALLEGTLYAAAEASISRVWFLQTNMQSHTAATMFDVGESPARLAGRVGCPRIRSELL